VATADTHTTLLLTQQRRRGRNRHGHLWQKTQMTV